MVKQTLQVPKTLKWLCACAQISKARADVNVTERDLLRIPTGPRTEACLRNNCVVGVQVRGSCALLHCPVALSQCVTKALCWDRRRATKQCPWCTSLICRP